VAGFQAQERVDGCKIRAVAGFGGMKLDKNPNTESALRIWSMGIYRLWSIDLRRSFAGLMTQC
jgi:hypothetical protein